MKLRPSVTSFFLLPLLLLYLSHQSCVSCTTNDDKKQEKLINILENLQLSISEILGTLGPTSASGSPPSRPSSSSSSSSSFSKASPGPSYVQRPDGGDYPTASGRTSQKEETTTDHIAVSEPSTTGNPGAGSGGKGKYAPGPAFRVSQQNSNEAFGKVFYTTFLFTCSVQQRMQARMDTSTKSRRCIMPLTSVSARITTSLLI